MAEHGASADAGGCGDVVDRGVETSRAEGGDGAVDDASLNRGARRFPECGSVARSPINVVSFSKHELPHPPFRPMPRAFDTLGCHM
jgi:hypothetical protein